MKKKVLIFSACNDFNAVELALENAEMGNKVFYLQCDSYLRVCQHNRFGNRVMCWHCKNSMSKVINKYRELYDINLIYLSDVIMPEDIEDAAVYKMDFNSVQDIKNLSYHGAAVGYGAFSSYVTFSRNVMPDIDDELRRYLGFLIKKEVAIFHALERLNEQVLFDQIIFHNGRFAQFKPFLEFSKIHKINFICTEHRISENRLLKDLFINDIPHSIDYVANNVLKNWDKGDPTSREEIGKSFFERRKKGLPAGDNNRVFVKGQHVGQLPAEWDDNVENISIFNSSEDEFLAVNKDYDSYLMFPNQFVALSTIFEHYKHDKTKHFYVRIHPNLKNVPYKSHLALHELKYDNVTIIPAESSISSYTLLEHSNKIIIFDSTMGVEATYSGKPVIALSKYYYTVLDMVYTPKKSYGSW